MFFKEHPFVRLLLPLILGILLSSYLKLSLAFLLVAVVVLLFFILLSYYWRLHIKYQYLFRVVLFLLLFSIGSLIRVKTGEALVQNASANMVYAKLLDVPKQSKDMLKATLQVEAIQINSIWKEEQFKSAAIFKNDSLAHTLVAGNYIVFTANFLDARQKANPFDFDYANYLQVKSISNSIFINKGKWVLVNEQGTGLKQKALNTRARLIHMYEKAGVQGDQLAVFSALTLGYKDKLDARVRNAYAGAGAMHVLAVSGLHVGIVFAILKFMLAWLKFFLKKERLRYAVILLGLWAYAFVTGLSPSVVRATVMFSFVLFGLVLGRKINVYNSLAASAFFILLYKPMLIYSVGFQLSYIAVVGIVFFHPYIKKWISFKYKFLNELWSLTAVSLAAQLVTFPIGLYYFHQFPSYFWLSNMVVLLSAGLLIYAAVLLLVLSPFANVISVIGKASDVCISWLNEFVFWVSELPMSVIQGVQISKVQVVLLYLSIIFMASYFITKKVRLLYFALLSVLVFLMVNLPASLGKKDDYIVSVYHNRKFSAIQFINKQTSYWLVNCSDSLLKIDDFVFRANTYWKTKNSFVYPLVCDTAIVAPNFIYKQGFFAFGNKSGMVLNATSKMPAKLSNLKTSVDYVLFTGNSRVGLPEINSAINYKTIVVDGTVPLWKQREWMNQDSLRMFFTAKQGAFICSN